MSITTNLNKIKSTLPADVKLVAVSKFHPVEDIEEAYNAGQRIFGESRTQEISAKEGVLPKDIEWHFIGHLQTNKVKATVAYTHTVHSVDSMRLLQEIEKQASLIGRQINCLLEIHIADEESKYGLTFQQCRDLINQDKFQQLKYVKVIGLMGMATNTNNKDIIRNEFRGLTQFFHELKNTYFKENVYFSEISMGMSDDYPIAIEEGATMVRVGSSIFGQRT